jgi:hypothetical protein
MLSLKSELPWKVFDDRKTEYTDEVPHCLFFFLDAMFVSELAFRFQQKSATIQACKVSLHKRILEDAPPLPSPNHDRVVPHVVKQVKKYVTEMDKPLKQFYFRLAGKLDKTSTEYVQKQLDTLRGYSLRVSFE